jgi:small GTP-binding protein
LAVNGLSTENLNIGGLRTEISMLRAKVVFVGAAHTGKTSMIHRFISNEFLSHTTPTTQTAFFRKQISTDADPFEFDVWDTAGQEQYHALSPLFYRDADAGIVVFDLTDRDSFVASQAWMAELKQARGEGIQIAVAGNKSDLISQQKISDEQMTEFAAANGAMAYKTSAKTGENIETLFFMLSKTLSGKMQADVKPKRSMQRRSSVRFDELPESPEEEPAGCC